MYFKRPLLLPAAAFLMGIVLLSPETGMPFRLICAALFPGLLLLSVRSLPAGKRLSWALLLSACLLAGGLRLRLAARAYALQEANIASFRDYPVRLRGTVLRAGEKDGKTRITVGDARLSSAYGDAASLPRDAPEALRARYNRPVGRILVYLPEKLPLLPGEIVECTGTMVPSTPPTNQGQFDFRLYNRSEGLSGSMYGDSAVVTGGEAQPFGSFLSGVRSRTADTLDRLCSPEDAGIFHAILTGDKGALDPDIRDLYARSGIAHILAISGMHLSIIGLGFFRILRLLHLGIRPAGALSALLILSYGILTGSSGSALRAVIMLMLRFLAMAAGRSYDMLTAAAAAAILLLVRNPFLLFNAGFQLSFSAILGIFAAAAPASRTQGTGLLSRLPDVPRLLLLPAAESLYASLTLQLVTLPVILYHYFQVPLYGILLNLLVLPLLSFLVLSGLAAVLLMTLLPGPLGTVPALVLYGGGHTILRFYTLLCTLAGRLPHALLIPGRPGIAGIGLYYLLLFYIFLSRTRPPEACQPILPRMPMLSSAAGTLPASFRTFLCLLAALRLLLPFPPSGLEITALDVGQGDGFLLRAGGRVISIDIGSTSNGSLGKEVLEPYLKSQGITCIDLSIITHCDLDHLSGIRWLLEESPDIRIRRLALPRPARLDSRYDPLREDAAARGCEIVYLGTGDCIGTGNSIRMEYNNVSGNNIGTASGDTKHTRTSPALLLECFYPDTEEVLEEANSHSIGALLTFGDFRMLFTGDMDKNCETVLLRNLASRGPLPDIDVLKCGHHGSATSTSEELLRLLRPEYALLSYGRDNRYGHPHAETLALLEDFGVRTIETGTGGELRIRTDGKHGYRIFSFL